MEAKVVSKIVKNLGGVISKNSPTILTGLAVAGLLTTTILAVRATPKATELIKADSRKQHDGDPYAYTKKEAFLSSWTCYVPTAISGAITIACIISANHISLRRNAALASLYSVTEVALKEYQAKVIETIGRNKEQRVRDDIAGDKIKNNPVESSEVIITDKGNVLCYDAYSGRYFRNDIEKIRRVTNELNHNLLTEMQTSLNDFYYEIGLPSIGVGYNLGWDVEHGLIEPSFSAQLTANEEPCLVLSLGNLITIK